MKQVIVLSVLLVLLLQSVTASEKVSSKQVTPRTPTAIVADEKFWTLIHGKQTQKNFTGVVDKLSKATIKDPRDIYCNAKLLKYYDSWPFRDLLERRISNIVSNVNNFRQITSTTQNPNPEISLISTTSISCAICHSGNANSHYEVPAWVGKTANEFLVPFK